ncbi:MAG: preprotein translocase subunit SecE [Rhizobiales bacterium]|nr:preprotein translocase subunit SecE [Hyphomicrobiales bacterium]
MAKTNPFQFLQEVREEGAKIAWPSRKEIIVSTIMVLIMVALASLFFLAVDAVIKWVVDTVIVGI